MGIRQEDETFNERRGNMAKMLTCASCPHSQTRRCGPFVTSKTDECPMDAKENPILWVEEDWRDGDNGEAAEENSRAG